MKQEHLLFLEHLL